MGEQSSGQMVPAKFALVALVALFALAHDVALAASEQHFQIHSYNDLREWPALLAKGASWFKVDPHWLANDTITPQCAREPLACQVLNHDVPDSKTAYNTTGELVDLLFHSPLFANRTAHVALCFKRDDDKTRTACDDAVWLDSVDALYQMIQSKQAAVRDGRRIHFILDGESTPTPDRSCLANRWTAWNATWILQPVDAFLSNQGTDGRFEYLNVPDRVAASALYAVALADFGKFAKLDAPYLYWEPSTEKDIAYAVDLFQAHGPQPHDYRFAINIDPAQFRAFAGNTTNDNGASWNGDIVTGGASNAHLVRLDDAHFALSWTSAASEHVAVFASSATAALPPPIASATADLAPFASLSPLASSRFLATSATGIASLFAFDAATTSLKHAASHQLPNTSDAVMSAVHCNGNATCVVVHASPSCPLAVGAFAVSAAGGVSSLGSTTCLSDAVPSAPASASVIVARPGPTSSCSGGIFAIVHVPMASDGSALAALAVCFDSAFTPSLGGANVVGPGSSPAAALSPDGRAAVLVSDSGYCWNTEVYNKRPSPKVCDQDAKPMSGIVAYSLAPVDTMSARIAARQASTPCATDGLLHGVVAMGHAPSAILLDSETLLLAREPLDTVPDDLLVCGASLAPAGPSGTIRLTKVSLASPKH